MFQIMIDLTADIPRQLPNEYYAPMNGIYHVQKEQRSWVCRSAVAIVTRVRTPCHDVVGNFFFMSRETQSVLLLCAAKKS